MILKRHVISLWFAVGVISALNAQDIHFTQFNAAPTLLNPAYTGVFNAEYRASIINRQQWTGIDGGYGTFAFSTDGGILKKKFKNSYIGVGLNAVHDVSGLNKLKTNRVNLCVSNVIYVNRNNLLSSGISVGFGQKSLDPNNFRWDNQFDGLGHNSGLPSFENFNLSPQRYLDYAVGLMWFYGSQQTNMTSNDGFMIKVGVSYNHLSRPNVALNIPGNDRLYSLLACTVDSHHEIPNSILSLRPRVYAFIQGPNLEISTGLMARIMLQEASKITGFKKEMALSVGGYYRLGDAVSAAIEIEVAQFALGFAYDMTTSSLSNSSFFGGPEIFLRFITPSPFRYSRQGKGIPSFK